MDGKYTLKFKKEGSETVKDSFSEWGIVCCSVPFKAGRKTKQLASRNWHDADGEDTYIPSQLMLEAYDAEFEMAYHGEELSSNGFNLSKCFQAMESFGKWLSGDGDEGASLSIYSPYSTIGRQGCYLLEIGSEEPCVMLKQTEGNLYNENIVTFKVKFRVTDPATNITLE